MYLETINNPSDLKRIPQTDLPVLAEEIRAALIEKSSCCGGHIASNLGLVEATIAIHYVFNSPKDKVIFDVSHQCYVHKMLTGRVDSYLYSDKYGDVSGFTNPEESDHDLFRTGHSSTSISLAAGLAKARDLAGSDEKIIAVIGDGSLSGGEALEGLDFCGSEVYSNLIILFNDNQMSIAENHGGIYKNLEELRKTKGKSSNNLFKAFGLDYLFVEDGNNVNEMIDALKIAETSTRPIVVHFCTVKGKGYKFAEEDPEFFHWAVPFDKDTGKAKRVFNGERYDKIARDFLMGKMRKDKSITTIIAAVPGSLAFDPQIRKEIGKQFIDVGIAEEHAVSMAAGIAKNGGKPVFVTLSTFYQRVFDQIAHEVCINKTPITMIVANASVYAVNEMTHIGIFDIPLLSNIPNLVYLAPTNKQEYLAMLDWSIEQNQYPVAIRAPRNGVFYAKEDVDKDYSTINRYKITQNGEKIAVFALGDFYQMGEDLCERIEGEFGIKPTLINPRYITGLDNVLLEQLKDDHDIIITLEDGVLDGGFGQKIASFYGKFNIRVLNFGLKKMFIDRYNVDDVLAENHLQIDMIIEEIKDINDK
ncbi:MAG: 1-deoxy-D-xylulose-5-phosphate synthase [Erysipelotrichia bacterium]|nr:1-deoxy-D-xylulose-5-phosphate synthase [Erysipelotrichia bacterium]